MIPNKPIIADGVRYYVEKETPDMPDHWKGFGGRQFTIVFRDGTLLRTSNLWMSYGYSPHVDTTDTATIHQGWEKPTEHNRMGWSRGADGNQYFGIRRARDAADA